MFDKLLREIKKLEREQTVSVPVKADKDGYLDKECPNKECIFQFKVSKDDWDKLFDSSKVYCPLCRHEAHDDAWWTTEQIEGAKREAIKHVTGRIDKALEATSTWYPFSK